MYRHPGLPVASGPPLRDQTPLPAAGAELGVIQPSGLRRHREFVGNTPVLRLLLGRWHHHSFHLSGLPALVEGDHVEAQLLGDLRSALAVRRADPTTDISQDSLAVRTH